MFVCNGIFLLLCFMFNAAYAEENQYLTNGLQSYSSKPAVIAVIERRSQKKKSGWIIDGVAEGEIDSDPVN